MGPLGLVPVLNTIILNTKKRNLPDNKIMISPHRLYFANIDLLVCILVYDIPPLENFIWGRRVSNNQYDQPDPPHIYQNPLPV